jgi:hypothetical protein
VKQVREKEMKTRKQRKTEKGKKEIQQVDISLPTFTPRRWNVGK